MEQETLSQLLERIDACGEARAWAKGKSSKRAWDTCERGDWMIWLLTNSVMTQDERLLHLLACDIAETVLHLVPAGEDRPRLAIEAARGFANGTVTREQMAAARAAARDAAWAAARDAARAAARDAARDAVWSAAEAAAGAAARDAAWAAARDAAWAAAGDAAEAAARSAAWAAAWSAARAAAKKQHADIVRKWFPDFPALRE